MSVRAVAIAIAASCVVGCGAILGLPSDYEHADASTSGDASGALDAPTGADAGIGADATADVVAPDAGVDASDGGVDAGDAGPLVPPSDPTNVACGSMKCPVATRVCCEETTMTSCVFKAAPNCNGGIVAECDESASCGGGESCCVTAVRSYGLETRCNGGPCGGQHWQSCRTNAECPNGQACVAWTCAGRVVATCNGFGSDAGCN